MDDERKTFERPFVRNRSKREVESTIALPTDPMSCVGGAVIRPALPTSTRMIKWRSGSKVGRGAAQE